MQSELLSSLSGVERKNREMLALSYSSVQHNFLQSIFSERLGGRIFIMGEDGQDSGYKDLLRVLAESGYEGES